MKVRDADGRVPRLLDRLRLPPAHQFRRILSILDRNDQVFDPWVFLGRLRSNSFDRLLCPGVPVHLQCLLAKTTGRRLVSTIAHLFRAGTPILIPKGKSPQGATNMSKHSDYFRDQAAAEYRAARKNSSFGTETREVMRTRAKAFKSLASNEEWLSGEADRITGARTRQTFAQK
jgi:hypothetical protein